MNEHPVDGEIRPVPAAGFARAVGFAPAARFVRAAAVVALAPAALALLLAACELPDPDDPDAPDTPRDSAQILADRLMDWQGGEDAWKATRFLAFDWIVERDHEIVARRSHAWNRWEGDYRLSFERDDGTRVVALFDVQSFDDDGEPRGDVWVDGDRLEGTARDSALDQSYRAFINDSYWLLMPLKWRDPGVFLAYEGWTELPDGEMYQKVHLSFQEGLGVTEDEYWGYVDPETGRMAAWRFHLEGQEERGPLIWWRDWREFGPQELKLAVDRRWADDDIHIRFRDVVADTEIREDAFSAPDG